MKKFSIAILAISMITTSHAQLNNWTGFYAGANAGFSFNNIDLKSQQLGFTNPNSTCNVSSDVSTFSPGILFGYLHQFANFYVAGVEANVNVSTDQTNTLRCNSGFNMNVYDGFTINNQMQTSVKVRGGRVLNWNNLNILPYLTTGLSVASVGLAYKNEGGDYYSNNTTQAGWLIGAGVEWAFRQHWSVRAEYNYVNYGNKKLDLPSVYGLFDPNGYGTADLSSNNVMIILNYWL